MKFRLLQCFMFAFACVMGTSGVSVWGGASDCESGQYWDTSENECKDCYLYGKIGTSGTVLVPLGGKLHEVKFDYTLWAFEPSGEGVTSCKVKLNVNESKCNTGTNVVYKATGGESQTYVFDTDSDYTVVPDDGYAKLYTDASSVAFNKDHCDKCPDGKYMNNANPKTCVACPNPATTNCGQSESEEDTNCRDSVNNRFGFTTRYNGDDGITGCAVELILNKDGCNSATNVVYVYNSAQSKYVRVVSDVFPNVSSVVSDPLPDIYDMSSSFCLSCPTDNYNVGGKCGTCKEAGYYLATSSFGGYMCVSCPAGSYCQEGETSKIQCPVNSYSEGNSSECKRCPMGYSTASSGPAADGYDGLCLGRDRDGENGFGVGCVSPDACKLTVASLSMNRSNGWEVLYLGDNVKIESLNKSVVKIIQDINHATMATGRPSGSPFDDFDDEE